MRTASAGSASGVPGDPAASDGPAVADPPADPPADPTGGRAADPAALPAGLDRLRLLAATGIGTVLISYGLVTAVGAALVLGSGGELTADGAFALAAPLWLAVHQVPLVLGGAPLSVLPLLPTIGLGALVAWCAGVAARRLGGRSPTDLGPVVATVAGAHGMVAVLVSAVLPPVGAVAAGPWAALLAAALASGVAAAFGAVRACGLPPVWQRAPGWLRTGLRAAAAGLAGLGTCAAMLVFASLVISVEQLRQLVAAPGTVDGAIGVTLLSVAYLPNALVAALSWLLGPGFGIGAATASPFGVGSAPLPNVPLMAAVPVNPPPGWAWLVFALPVLVGCLVGWSCRPAGSAGNPVPAGSAGSPALAGGPAERLRAAGVASVGLGIGVAALATVAGGRLAAGPFDPVSVPAWLAACAAVLWIAPPALAVAGYGPRQAELLAAAWRALRLGR